MKRAEDDISLEMETDGAPRRRKPSRRYMDSDGDDEDEENKMPPKKKDPRKSKVRKLSESDDESGCKTFSQVNYDILNAVRENNSQMHQVQVVPRRKHPEGLSRIEIEGNLSRIENRKNLKMLGSESFRSSKAIPVKMVSKSKNN